MTFKKAILIAIGVVLAIVIMVSLSVYFGIFGAPQKTGGLERFVIVLNSSNDEVIQKLKDSGFVKSAGAMRFVWDWKGLRNVEPGGYQISKSMNAWEVADVLQKGPYMKWVVIPEGLRKEEIAGVLTDSLGWSEAQKNEWIKKDTAKNPDYIEGVYFPDTYLISKSETPSDVADRLRSNFEAKFAPLSKDALKQNIKWNTALKLASIVQREAGGINDMPLVAGILWNRLDKGMPLGVDATLQYARGETSDGWWLPITLADKKINSPYNSYTNKGLPPTPISNPGIEAIRAVIFPQKTDCLYYLHDSSKQIHCAKTYDEHKKNIEKYLK